MSQPANDEFSQHLSDDEESNHEDASDTGAAPKQQQQVIPQTTAILNIKPPILKKEKIQVLKKERRLNEYLMMAIPKEHNEKISWIWMMQKRSGEAQSELRFGVQKALAMKKDMTDSNTYCSLVGKIMVLKYPNEDANHKFLRSFPQHGPSGRTDEN
ncbi:hypothetical protein Tco_0002379 [Tanacetum coccineum]